MRELESRDGGVHAPTRLGPADRAALHQGKCRGRARWHARFHVRHGGTQHDPCAPDRGREGSDGRVSREARAALPGALDACDAPRSSARCARRSARSAAACARCPSRRLAPRWSRRLLERTSLDPARIDDVVFAQSYANGETPCIGRWVALEAGLPIEVPGMQLDRRCGGGLQAVVTAAMMVQTRRRRRRHRRRRREHEQHRVLHDRHALGRALRAR